MPGGILEALSYGIPCLVTRGTNLGEKIVSNNCGWMAENNASSIAESIKRVIEERDTLPEKSQNAAPYVESNYSWKAVARDALDAYKKCLEENQK